MLQKFKQHIDTDFPFLKDKKLLIAISGGVDSVVLTHLFSELKYDIALAHCNFNLRDIESDLDEKFVENISKNIDCQFFNVHFNTNQIALKNKQSTQVTARNLRYKWFNELVEQHNYDYVLTAHHADDNLETFLINLTRGSGIEGFTGIPKINGNSIRPLLVFSRQEIISYAEKNKIQWREDKSNASTKYTRNKIRHQVVPILKEINPSLLDTFAKTSKHLQESKQIIADRIDEVALKVVETCSSNENGVLVKIDIQKLQELSNSKAYLYQLLEAYNFTEWDDVYHLLSAQSGKQVFSKTHRLLKDRNFLLLSKKENQTSVVEDIFLISENISEITRPIHLKIETVNEVSIKNNQTIYLDKNKLKFPLVVRKWKNGDYFYPSGMQGKKKISKYFKDEKMSLLEKENKWLLCNENNEIIWVVGRRADQRFLSNKETKNILKITS